MRAYRNGRLVFRHVQPYNPSGAFSLRFQSNDALVRLMNPVEEVDIS
jgi:hypothetical protein